MLEFIEAHQVALSALAKALVMLTGGCGLDNGIDWLQDPPKILYFDLVPRNPLGHPGAEGRRFPSLFKLVEHSFVTVEELKTLSPAQAAEWERLAPSRALEERRLLESDPHYDCTVPVCFFVRGIPTVHYISYYPLHRSLAADMELTREEGWEDRKRRVVEEILHFCLNSVQADFSLRVPDDPGCRVPLPGRVVRSHGSRIWRPFFNDWREYRPGIHEGLDVVMRSMRVTQDMEALMKLFSYL